MFTNTFFDVLLFAIFRYGSPSLGKIKLVCVDTILYVKYWPAKSMKKARKYSEKYIFFTISNPLSKIGTDPLLALDSPWKRSATVEIKRALWISLELQEPLSLLLFTFFLLLLLLHCFYFFTSSSVHKMLVLILLIREFPRGPEWRNSCRHVGTNFDESHRNR